MIAHLIQQQYLIPTLCVQGLHKVARHAASWLRADGRVGGRPRATSR